MATWLPNVPPEADSTVQISMLNQVIDILNSRSRTTVISDEKSNRYLIGYQKNGWGEGIDFGIKVSKPGVDVTEASDDQLLFSDSFDTQVRYDEDGNKVLETGKLPNDMFGDLYYLNDTPHIIITPDTGMVAAEEGTDVTEEV